MVMTSKESADFAEMKAQIEAFKAAAKRKRSLSISPKGCVTLRGLRRFGVAFYPNEWEQIAEELPAILEFMVTNKNELEATAAAHLANNG